MAEEAAGEGWVAVAVDSGDWSATWMERVIAMLTLALPTLAVLTLAMHTLALHGLVMHTLHTGQATNNCSAPLNHQA